MELQLENDSYVWKVDTENSLQISFRLTAKVVTTIITILLSKTPENS